VTRSVRFRFFVIAKDESLCALSCKTLDDMTSRAGRCALPHYSGTELRIAQVRVENIGKAPTRMLDVLCSTLPINAKGFVDHDASDVRASDAFAAFLRGTSRPTRAQAWSPSPKQRAAMREAALGRCRLPYFRISASL
jgi:hypothetical protein